MRFGRALLAFTAFGLSCAGARDARSADPAPAEAAPSVVQVYVAGNEETVARTRITVQELLARLDLPVIVRDAAGAGEQLVEGGRSRATVSAYIDLRSIAAPRVIVVDGVSGAELERRTLPSATSVETAVEAASHVLYMTVESVVKTRADESAARRPQPSDGAAGAPAPVTVPTTNERGSQPTSPPPDARTASEDERAVTEPPSPDADDEETAAKKPSRAAGGVWGANAAVFGALRSFGASRILGGAGATVDVAAQRLVVYPGAFASLAYFAPGKVEDGGASGTLSALSVRAGPLVGWNATSFVAPFAGAALGLDVVRFAPGSPPPFAASLGTDSSTDLVVALSLGAKFKLARSLAASAGFAIDVDTAPTRYVVESGGQRASLFDLSRVRPSAFLGLSLSFAGAPHFGVHTR